MTTAFEVPFEPQASNFIMDLVGTSYLLATSWNTESLCWTLDISTVEGALILGGIPIVPGVDLLGQYAYLGFTGKLFVQMAGDATVVPGYADLGVQGLVFFVVP